jgi:putative transposase
MPRPRRYAPPDSVLHLVNRGNDRKLLFSAPEAYEDFLRVVRKGKQRSGLRLIAYCLMPNHWHMVVWPRTSTEVSSFCHWIATVHAIRHRRETETIGHGHLYQDRYHSFAIESERRYYEVIRYVEANPVRAGLAALAQDWRWSSASERTHHSRGLLDVGPLPLPSGWVDTVNESLPTDVLEDLRTRCGRTKPYDLRLLRRVGRTAANRG